MAEKFTDILTYVLSAALAAGVLGFAAYKIVRLNQMENPPANMGLNFPPAKRRMIVEPPALAADPITTQSLGPVHEAAPPARSPAPGEILSYDLLTVVDGVAFIEMAGTGGKVLVPATLGTRLPGGLRVEAIRRRDGRWTVTVGNLELQQTRLGLQ